MTIAFRSALDLADMIRRREIGAVELLELYFGRIDTVDTVVNAVVWQDRERALETAKAADSRIDVGDELPTLHGVPMTIKESFDIAGAPTTWGDPTFRENIAENDSVAVERFKRAGVTVFGKTNVPLNLADWQSFNDIYGVTSNPWDTRRTPGGSSGGSAAALAAGLTGIETGSDIGASIRNPAHYCGVFGHKPSFGICPPRGQALPGILAGADMAVIGPMARSAGDLETALAVMAGPDVLDAAGWRLELPAPRARSLGDLRVAVMLESTVCEVDGAYLDMLQGMVDGIARTGASISDVARPRIDMRDAHETYIQLLRAATSARMSRAKLEEFQAARAHLDPGDVSYLALMTRGNTMMHRDWIALNERREHIKWAWHDFFREWDVMISPVAAATAFPHDHAGERHDRTIVVNGREVSTTDQMFWAGFGLVALLPATVAPAGVSRDGLPAGVQITGPWFGDLTTIEVARLLEREFGGFQPPPDCDTPPDSGNILCLTVCAFWFWRKIPPWRCLPLRPGLPVCRSPRWPISPCLAQRSPAIPAGSLSARHPVQLAVAEVRSRLRRGCPSPCSVDFGRGGRVQRRWRSG